MRLDEVGWQVAIPAALAPYSGPRRSCPTTEASQASIYASLVRYEACDPSVDALLFLGLRDEPNLSRWQAGLMRADGSPRPSYRSVQTVLSRDGRQLRRHECGRGGTRRPWMAPQRPFRAAVTCRGGSAPGTSPQQPPKTRASERASAACAKAGDRSRPVRARSHRSARDALDPLSAPPPRAGPVRLLDPLQSRSEPRPQDAPHEPPLRRHSLIEPRPVPGTKHVQLRQARRGGPRRRRSRRRLRADTGFARVGRLRPDRPAASAAARSSAGLT